MHTGETKGEVFITTLIGAMAGFLFLHPYTMIVYMLHERHEVVINEFYHALRFSFQPSMLHMGIPFAILGGVLGLLFGLWHNADKKRHELEKQLKRWTS